ncbi:MAG: hypothetical protein Q8L22_22815 [Reyranella sp.]|nr:hypothetical protein [Reyranella sp.]
MFQIVGSILALVAVVATLAAAPVYGIFFAVATLCWVVKAKPAQATRIEYYAADGGIVILA